MGRSNDNVVVAVLTNLPFLGGYIFSSGRPARQEFATATLPNVFSSVSTANAYLEELSIQDDREAREFLLENDSGSGSSEDTRDVDDI